MYYILIDQELIKMIIIIIVMIRMIIVIKITFYENKNLCDCVVLNCVSCVHSQ